MSKSNITRQVSVPLEEARILVLQMQTTAEAVKKGVAWFFETESRLEQFLSQQTFSADRLARLANTAEQTERVRAQEAADDDLPRNVRDQAYEVLLQALFDGRTYLDNGLGAESSERYGFAGELRVRPADLFSIAGNTISLMEGSPQQSVGRFGGGTNTAAVVAEFRPLHAALGAALDVVERESLELREARTQRNEALTRLISATSAVLNTYIASLTLAGRPDLIRIARAIRRSRRSKSSTQSEASEATPENTDPNDAAPEVAPQKTVAENSG